MNRNQRFFVTVLCIGILMVFGYVVLPKETEQNDFAKAITKETYVKTTVFSPSVNHISYKGHGRVTAARRINITPEVQGKLLPGDVPLKQGTSFDKGDVLFRIKNTEAQLALKAKKSTFLNRVATILPDVQIDFPSHFNAWNDFFNAIDVDKSLPTLPAISNSQLKTFLATKNLLTDYYSILVDEERLGKYTVKAPFSGTIVSVNAETGTSVNLGSPVATIINTSNLEVEIPLTKEQTKLISKGCKVLLTKENQEELIGTVSRIAKSINANTQSISVYVSTNTSQLNDGMYLSAEIIAKSINNTIKVPVSALQKDGNIYHVNNNKLIQHQVKVDFKGNGYAILSGVSNTLNVVVENIDGLKEGAIVKTIDVL